jgi:putative oxidoreductase
MERLNKFSPEALSIMRIIVGLLFVEHGSAALLGFPATDHPAPGFLTLIWVQRILELGGGFLMVIGLFTRPVAFILAGDMAVAYFMVHAPKSFFPMINGGDAAILYCFVYLFFFVSGPGRWSVDGQIAPSGKSVPSRNWSSGTIGESRRS